MSRRVSGIGKAAFAVVGTCAAIAALASGCSNPEPKLVVTGTVTDSATGQPIPGATVSDDGYGPQPYRGTTTDEAGTYQYMTWPEEHAVMAQAPGYKPQRQGFSTGILQTEKKKVLDFALTRE